MAIKPQEGFLSFNCMFFFCFSSTTKNVQHQTRWYLFMLKTFNTNNALYMTHGCTKKLQTDSCSTGFLWGHTTQVYYTVCKGNDMVIVNYESQQWQIRFNQMILFQVQQNLKSIVFVIIVFFFFFTIKSITSIGFILV